MEPCVAGAADGKQQVRPMTAGAAVMDDQAGRGPADPASAPITGEDPVAVAAEAAARVDFLAAAASAVACSGGAAGAKQPCLGGGRAHSVPPQHITNACDKKHYHR